MAPFNVKLLLPFIRSHSLGKVSSTLSPPIGSRCYCFWSSVLFWWNTHQGTENYFSLRETDFGLKNCRRNYSKFDRTQHTQPQRLLRSFTKLAYLWENLLSALITSDLLPLLPGPSGFAHHVSYPLDKALFTHGITRCSAPRGVSSFPGNR